METGKSQPQRAKTFHNGLGTAFPILLLTSLFFSDKHTVVSIETELK